MPQTWLEIVPSSPQKDSSGVMLINVLDAGVHHPKYPVVSDLQMLETQSR